MRLIPLHNFQIIHLVVFVYCVSHKREKKKTLFCILHISSGTLLLCHSAMSHFTKLSVENMFQLRGMRLSHLLKMWQSHKNRITFCFPTKTSSSSTNDEKNIYSKCVNRLLCCCCCALGILCWFAGMKVYLKQTCHLTRIWNFSHVINMK